MVLVDTSVWIDVLRDESGRRGETLELATGDAEIMLSRFTQMELPQGAAHESDRDFETIAELGSLRQLRLEW